MAGIYQGEQQTAETKGMKFTKKMEGIIKNTKDIRTLFIAYYCQDLQYLIQNQ